MPTDIRLNTPLNIKFVLARSLVAVLGKLMEKKRRLQRMKFV